MREDNISPLRNISATKTWIQSVIFNCTVDVALCAFCFFFLPSFTWNKTKTLPLTLILGLTSRLLHCPGGVRGGSCPGCRGRSQMSWCPSQIRLRCARPQPGASPVFACGWHRVEPRGPGSQNGPASHQTDPESDTETNTHFQKHLVLWRFTAVTHT